MAVAGGATASVEDDQSKLLPTGSVLSDDTNSPVPAPKHGQRYFHGDGGSELFAPFTAVANSAWVNHGSTALVLLNMLIMCLPYYGMTESYAARLELYATVITWIFVVEMGVKLIGLGCAAYWGDSWNRLDGTIVTMSLVEMIGDMLAAQGDVNVSFLRVLRMLRMLRVLRMLRLMRSWRGLYTIISTLIRAIPQMGNILVLILLTMFMFALLGTQLFGGIYTPSNGYSLAAACPSGVCPDGLEERPLWHFDFFMPSMLTVFILLTGEWVDALEPAAAILGPQCALFFILVVLLGKFLLLNLLIAVILTEFADGDTASESSTDKAHTPRDSPGTVRPTSRDSSPMTTPRPPEKAERPKLRGAAKYMAELAAPPPPWPEDYSLLLFNRNNPLRKLCKNAISQPQFDQLIIAAIIVSSICLALDSPRIAPDAPLLANLRRADLFFTGLFFTEMATKIIAQGFYFAKDAYIRNPWNQVPPPPS